MAGVVKVSVSLTSEELDWARERAAESGKSLSSVMSEALRRQRQTWARAKVLAELGESDISQADLDAVRTEWRKRPRKQPRARRR